MIFRINSRASALRACHFCFGKSNQNHLRQTLADTMKPHRFPALLSKSGPARTRTSMCSDMRALLPLSLPVLGSLYGARARSTSEASSEGHISKCIVLLLLLDNAVIVASTMPYLRAYRESEVSMNDAIRFQWNVDDVVLYEKLRSKTAKAKRVQNRSSTARVVMGIAFAVFFAIPFVLFISSHDRISNWFFAYLLLFPWIAAFASVPFLRRKDATRAANKEGEIVARLVDSNLHIERGNMFSIIKHQGIRAVSLLKEHMVLLLEDETFFLIPLRAFPTAQLQSEWYEALTNSKL